VLTAVHPTLNDHVYDMRSTCVVHVVWHHFVPEPSTLFSQVSWSDLWLMWQCDRQTLTRAVSKNRKEKRKRKDNKLKEKNKKMKSTVNDLNNYEVTIWLTYSLTLSIKLLQPALVCSRPLWHHIMWHVMWLQSHTFSCYRLIIYYCPIYILSKFIHTLSYHNNMANKWYST